MFSFIVLPHFREVHWNLFRLLHAVASTCLAIILGRVASDLPVYQQCQCSSRISAGTASAGTDVGRGSLETTDNSVWSHT